MSSFRVLQSPTPHPPGTTETPIRFRCLPEDETTRWDAFVKRHPHGLIYHLSAWREVLERSFPHIKGHFLVVEENDTGEIIAGLPAFHVQSWLLGRRLVSSPFATLSDPLISSPEALPTLLTGLKLLQVNLGVKRIELRSFQTSALLQSSGFEKLAFYKQHFLPLTRPFPDIVADFSRTAVRRMVAKAQKNGVTVLPIASLEQLDEFFRLLSETRRNLNLPAMPRHFFLELWRKFNPQHLSGFLAIHQGRAVAAALGLRDRGVFTLEFSGENAEAPPGANQLLYFEAIQRAHALGDHLFHFGRTAATNTGLLQYKRHWATAESDLPIFYSPAVPAAAPETSPTYHLVRSIIRCAPGFSQKLIGQFCYRHLG